MFLLKPKSFCLPITLLLLLFLRINGATQPLKQKSILNIMHKVADWQLNEWNTKGFKHPPGDWTNAACYTGIYALGAIKDNDKYLSALTKTGNDLQWNTGANRFMADDYCIGQTYSLLYTKYQDKKMKPLLLNSPIAL